MLRKLMLSLALLAAIGFAAAQTQININPTEGTGEDQIAKGALEAAVTQTVELILPKATALHLDASTITFDLRNLDGEGWDDRASSGAQPDNFDLACVYVTGNDVTQAFNGQTQVVPGGIAYAADAWNQIHLIYFGNDKSGNVPDSARVVNYPPLRLDGDGELVPHSKDYFVCYQTFVMQLFSNLGTWDLSVERIDDINNQGIEHLYIQANTCANFGQGTGLYDLPDGATRSLIPSNLVVGPTGDHVNVDGSQCSNTNSSWLDVLGVLAVKINSDQWGTSTANLTYTLMSPDPTPQ